MRPEHVHGLISLIGIFVQLGGTALLVVLFVLLRRYADGRRYFVTWTYGWVALGVALSALVVRYVAYPVRGPMPPLLGIRPTIVWDIFYQTGKFIFAAALVTGALQYAGRRPSRLVLRLGAALLAVFGVVSAFATTGFGPAVALQAAVAVPAYLVSGLLLVRTDRGRRGGTGPLLTGGVCLLLAGVWLFYAIAFAQLNMSTGGLLQTPFGRLVAYTSYFDLLCQVLLGFGMVVLVMEDTHREAEESRGEQLRAAADSRARLSGIIRSALDAIVSTDEEDRIRLFNSAAESMFATPASAAIGAPINRFIGSPYTPQPWAGIDPSLGGSPLDVWHGEVIGHRHEGDFPIEVSMSTLHAEAGPVRTFILRDLSERRRTEHEREQLQSRLGHAQRIEAVGRLVSGVAHELNNPLAAILTFSETLLCDPRSPEDVEALTVIHEQAERSRAIVRDLLAFVRRREVRRERLTPAQLLEPVVRGLAPELTRTGAVVECVTDANPVLVVDGAGFEQVFTNLLLNALQAAEGGLIRVVVREVPGACEIAVEDDGPGIPPALLTRIFEPFFTTKPAGRGTGLGLSVSLGVVEQHGGTLRAENRPVRGARFVLTVPITEVESDGNTAPSLALPSRRRDWSVTEPLAVPEGLSRRVLVIDDEPGLRTAVRRLFRRLSWDVDEAEDGRVGLARLLEDASAERYALVICDLRMPHFSGVELYDWLAASRPDLLARLVFVTGDTASSDASAFLARTKCPVLEKPFELQALVDVVKRVIAEAQPA